MERLTPYTIPDNDAIVNKVKLCSQIGEGQGTVDEHGRHAKGDD